MHPRSREKQGKNERRGPLPRVAVTQGDSDIKAKERKEWVREDVIRIMKC